MAEIPRREPAIRERVYLRRVRWLRTIAAS